MNSPKKKAPNAANNQGGNFNNLKPDYSRNDKNLPLSTGEIFTKFRQFIAATVDYSPDTIEASGKLIKFSTNGKQKDLAGWYICHEHTILLKNPRTGELSPQWGIIGLFGDWRQFGKTTFKWNSFSVFFELSREERANLERRQRELSRQREQERKTKEEQAYQQSVNLWLSSPAADPAHPYLLKKRVGVYGIRQHRNMLLIPVCDLDGVLHGIQRIYPDGSKFFLEGTPPTGHFCLVGNTLTDPQGVYLCEGYATAASLHETYGQPVLSCFNCGNLLPVARAYRERFPHIPLTVCADNDRDPASKGYLIGLTKAREVCAALPGVGLIVPEFPAGTPLKLSDFNDLVSLLGSSEQKETAA
ncbi:MAG: hypothetical protein JG718_10980 [Candidatus Thiothrix moscowensis]|nr:hypothetical protein [Candidatus Thiothrix moscowensis]